MAARTRKLKSPCLQVVRRWCEPSASVLGPDRTTNNTAFRGAHDKKHDDLPKFWNIDHTSCMCTAMSESAAREPHPTPSKRTRTTIWTLIRERKTHINQCQKPAHAREKKRCKPQNTAHTVVESAKYRAQPIAQARRTSKTHHVLTTLAGRRKNTTIVSARLRNTLADMCTSFHQLLTLVEHFARAWSVCRADAAIAGQYGPGAALSLSQTTQFSTHTSRA